jgi:hypothetical protein
MANINRSDDVTQQQFDVNRIVDGTATGTTDAIYKAPMALEIQSAKLSAYGLSGSPTVQLSRRYFVVGAGETVSALGAALALVAAGTSGAQTYTFSATSVNAGDQIVAVSAGSNAAAAELAVNVVLKWLPDYKSWSY